MVAEVPTVIAPDDNDGLGSHGGIGIEGGEHAAELIICIAGGSEVSVDKVAGFIDIRNGVRSYI